MIFVEWSDVVRFKASKFLAILVLLVIVLVLQACNRDSNNDLKSYLMKNHTPIHISDAEPFADLRLMESDLEGKRIFLVGETHGNQLNSAIKWKFMAYIKEKTNFKYLLSESSYSDSYYVNRYLETGDEAYLQTIFKFHYGTAGNTLEEYQFYTKLYQYNQSFDVKDQIRLVGVDIEHSNPLAIQFLGEILENVIIDERAHPLLAQFKQAIKTNLSYEQGERLVKELHQDWKNRPESYQQLLGERHKDFGIVLQNMINKSKAYASKFFDSSRDNYISDNFQRFYLEHPGEILYGQWGMGHIYQGATDAAKWFGAYLNEIPEFKNNIVSVAIGYLNCSIISPNDHYDGYQKWKITSFEPDPEELPIWNGVIKAEQAVLFKLDGKRSPFAASIIPLLNQTNGSPPVNGVTTDYYQYLIVLQNAQASKPFSLTQ
jgi:hypothetical protein